MKNMDMKIVDMESVDMESMDIKNMDMKDMNMKKYGSIIESLLFASGDPISTSEIKRALDDDIDEGTIKRLIEALTEDYRANGRGLDIIKLERKYQMCTSDENFEYVSKLISRTKKKSLSQASMETLTIIAYTQPVTKAEVEEIRGVNSDGVIRNLLENKLIYEAGKLDRIGKPIIYRTTDKFLKLMSFESIKELPKLKGVETAIEREDGEIIENEDTE